MTNLLFDERPLVLQPKLAYLLGGSEEGLILQQVHYWTQMNTNIKDGYSWVYNSMKGWHEQFYWLSESKVKRTFTKLEKLGVLVTANYNKAKFDKTKWYRIDYGALEELEQRLDQSNPTSEPKRINRMDQNDSTNGPKLSNRMGQNDPTSGSNRTNGVGQNAPTYTIDYTETTTETNTDIMSETKNVSDNTHTSVNKKDRYATDSKEYRCALKLHEEILKNRPNFKKPNLQKWADTFRLMHERDNRDWKEIGKMIIYATQDDFWKANILSPEKLRKQFDLLEAQQEWNNKPRRPQIIQRESLPEWVNETHKKDTVQKLTKSDRDQLNEEIDALFHQLEEYDE